MKWVMNVTHAELVRKQTVAEHDGSPGAIMGA
jgi:hypothetical protein